MKILSFDFETTMFPDAMPWQIRAKPVTLHTFDGNTTKTYTSWEDIDLTSYDVIIAHNAKFDLHWLEALNIPYNPESVYCTMVGEYVIRGCDPALSYSLDTCCKRYGITDKIDRVKPYWESDIDTPDIPLSILIPYGEQDAVNAFILWQKQQPIIAKYGLHRIIRLEMDTVCTLQTMEQTGMVIDLDFFKKKEAECVNALIEVEDKLKSSFGYNINWGSGDQLSAALFGGTFQEDGIESVWKEYKTTGRKLITRKCKKDVTLQGFFTPEPEWETKKQGVYKTDVSTLMQIKARTKHQKEVLRLIQLRSKLSTELNTFYIGWQKAICDDGLIHGTFNQTIARTGRLTSSHPNQQNLPRAKGGVKNGIKSRY